MNHSKLEEKEIELECNVDEDIYIIIEKLSFINSVMNTLLRNAIKYSYPKSKIFISARKSKDADEVILSVKDYGIGIPEQIQENLFRINIPTTREGTAGETGIGIRMALLKKLINAYGGRVEIKSSTKTSDPWTEVLLYLSLRNIKN